MSQAVPFVVETDDDRPSSGANEGGAQVKSFIAEHRLGLRLPAAPFYQHDEAVRVHAGPDKTAHIAIAKYFQRALSAGLRPVALGGDHRVTLHILRAVFSSSCLPGLVILDAHTDCQGMKDPLSNYNVLGKIRETFPDLKMILVGARDVDVGAVRQEGIFDCVIDADEFNDAGVKGTVEIILNIMGNGKFYLSIDLDVLDPLVFPCVAAPVSGGLQPAHLFGLIRGLKKSIIAADIVEFLASRASAPHYLLITDLYYHLTAES